MKAITQSYSWNHIQGAEQSYLQQKQMNFVILWRQILSFYS